ncbi:MAG: radical SAM family heme chaperone HemW [Halioglobus sp.]
MSGLTPPPISLYIHYPWCERKCPYCDFNSHESAERPERDYVLALLSDLQNDLKYLQGRAISSLFIGGGTPSLIDPINLKLLMDGIADSVDFATDFEATLEANPGSAEADKFCAFRQAGINRLSLGIQSFQDQQLETLGRVHNSDQAHAAIQMAANAGFDSFNLDIMHGLPGQTVEAAIDDISTALSYSPRHMSWYQLTIEPNTVYYRRPPVLPLEDTLGDIQTVGEQLLTRAGLNQYEVSAYSQQDYRCRHNLNYWSFGDYLGIGAGAHGKVTRDDGSILRYSKRKQPKEYLRADEATFCAKSHTLERSEIAGEFMLNALRMNNGFDLTTFTARTGLQHSDLQPELDTMINKGLLQRDELRLRTTDLGRRFLDSVTAEFF